MSNPKKNIENIRIDYDKSKIDFNSINTSPFTLFNNWMTQAFQADKENANAFVLSTISNEIAPSSRVVLMRGFSEKRDAEIHSKIAGIYVLHALVANKNKADLVITDMVNYAGSTLEASSIYAKVYQ